jgi:hypothetical protein
MPTVSTILQVKDGVRLITSRDFILYYQWFLKKQFPWIKFQSPAHGSHITLCRSKIHQVNNFKPVEHLEGSIHEIEYSLDMYKSPKNFWLPVITPDIYYHVKEILNFSERPDWLGLHLTICNTKFLTSSQSRV